MQIVTVCVAAASLEECGVVSAWDAAKDAYDAIPSLPMADKAEWPDTSITQYALSKGLAGLQKLIEEKETGIRKCHSHNLGLRYLRRC